MKCLLSRLSDPKCVLAAETKLRHFLQSRADTHQLLAKGCTGLPPQQHAGSLSIASLKVNLQEYNLAGF